MFTFHNAAWRVQREDGHSTPVRPHDAIAASRWTDIDTEMTTADAVEPLPQPQPLPASRPPRGSSQELTSRFASMLTFKEAVRAEKLASSNRTTTKTKNCASHRKLARRRLAHARRHHDAAVRASITALQQNIATMERARTLADSHVLLWRTNRSGVVVDMCREYFAQFAQGYDSTSSEKALGQHTLLTFLHSIANDDLLCREYCGLDKLLAQWEIYTKFHSDITCRLRHIALIDEEDEVVSIRCRAELELGISDATLRHLYPTFYAQAQENAKARQIADGLIGRRYVVAFDKVFHFNRHGKWFAHESKVHLASSLLEVLGDPFAALEVLEGSVMTIDGHWNTPDVDYMRIDQADMYEMPKLML